MLRTLLRPLVLRSFNHQCETSRANNSARLLKRMSLTEEQVEKLSFMLQEIVGNEKDLNDWEQGFFRDQVERYEKYGANIHLSAKQWKCIEKIHQQVTGG